MVNSGGHVEAVPFDSRLEVRAIQGSTSSKVDNFPRYTITELARLCYS